MRKIEYNKIKLNINGLLFTWDDEKEKINVNKHGVKFGAVATIFFDENAVFENNSIDKDTGEERFDIIGWVLAKVMFVVFAERTTIDGSDIIRIISARRATKEEKKRYVNGL